MSRRPPPQFDATALTQALGGRAPLTSTRAGRVQLLGEVFQALLDGRLPSHEAALFVGGAGMAWLSRGGNLERDYLQVTKPKSHNTPARIWEQFQAEATAHHDEGQESPDPE